MSGCLRPVLLVRLLAELRKKCGLEHTDMVVVYFESLDEDKSVSDRVLHSQEQYINVIIHGVSGMSCNISLVRPV